MDRFMVGVIQEDGEIRFLEMSSDFSPFEGAVFGEAEARKELQRVLKDHPMAFLFKLEMQRP